jgi:hypothetical protein
LEAEAEEMETMETVAVTKVAVMSMVEMVTMMAVAAVMAETVVVTAGMTEKVAAATVMMAAEGMAMMAAWQRW